MTYDFETMPDRRGTNAEALDLIGRKGAVRRKTALTRFPCGSRI